MAVPSPSQNKSKKARRKSASPGASKQGHLHWLPLTSSESQEDHGFMVPSNKTTAFQSLDIFPESSFLDGGQILRDSLLSGRGSFPSGVLVRDGVKCRLLGRWTHLDTLSISEYLHVNQNSVLMHPETMRTCGCVFSSSVVVRGCDNNTNEGKKQPYVCGKVLPLPSLPLDMVGLGSSVCLGCQATEGDFVEVWPLSLPSSQLPLAGVVTLQSSAKLSFTVSSAFKKRIFHMCGDCLVTPHSRLSVPYLGEETSFSIMNLKASSDHQPHQHSSDDKLSRGLELDLSKLSLNESGDFSDGDALPTLAGLDIFKLSSRTEIRICTEPAEAGLEDESHSPRLSNVGGLEKQLWLLSDLVLHPLDAVSEKRGFVYPSGVLLHGPPGVGKSLVARALAGETSAHSIQLSAAQLLGEDSGTVLKKTFQEARQRCPCLVIIDDLDSLCPHGDDSVRELDRKATACLLTQLDDLRRGPPHDHIAVLATTNQIDHVAPQLRCPGRFEKEVEFPVPSSKDRVQILDRLLTRVSHSLSQDDISRVAEKAHGYVGADLLAVCTEAQYKVLHRELERERREKMASGEEVSTQNSTHTSTGNRVIVDDMLSALREVRPSAMREVTLEVPKVLWSEIGGQEEVKICLREAVERPITHPEAYAKMGTRPPKGVLLYGPPGCSKTMVARALATESGLNFLAVKGPELFSKWVGDSEKAVRQIFSRARSAAPAIIFFDEIDALAVERKNEGSSVADRVLTQLLTEMDGVENLGNVLVVAATNRPDMIDKALLRPGRIDELIYVPLPSDSTRKEIFQIQFSKIPVDWTEVVVEQLVLDTKGFSGAEVVSLCQKASLYALRGYFDSGCADLDKCCVKASHFEEARKVVLPQTSPETLKYYEDFKKKQKNVFNSEL